MTQTTPRIADEDRVLAQLDGATCTFCEEGRLERGEFDGSPAAICPSCGIPQARFS